MDTLFQKACPRIAALTGLVLAALLLGSRVAAQATGPLTTSPPFPTPYQAQTFHNGGASTPYPQAGVAPLIDPLAAQLQGTPTGYYPLTIAGVPTQIPSFLLGNYVPGQPPTTAGVYFPDHFADGFIYSWAAPFAYVPTTNGSVTVDDSDALGFTSTNFVALPIGTTGDYPAGTATNGNYRRLNPQTLGSAVWTLTATNPGSFSVYFHLPDDIADSAGNTETRSSSVTYNLTITTAAGGITTGTATVSQTEANSSQFLAGPFQLAIGDTVQVTLQRTAGATGINELPDSNNVLGNYYLIADSMTLESTIGDVQSTPTAINATAYPTDFARAVYWGIDATKGGLPTNPNPTDAQYLDPATGDAVPDTGTTGTTPVLRYGLGNPLLTDASHEIRQLVYFGRAEPTFTNQYTIDDNSGSFASGGAFTTVVNTGTGAASATNGEYRTAAAVNAPTAPSFATWTITPVNGGNYFVTVHLPTATTGETRIPDAQYTVTVGGVVHGPYTVNQVTTTGDYLLPTGPIPVQPGEAVVVSLSNLTATPLTVPAQSVVADSVTITTGTGGGAIYCVDGFTGGVVWRYEVPGSANGPSSPVFSSPAVAKINVLTSAGTYANKLVVIVGDNNGLVYCLDAIGNGDGTSNTESIDPTTGQPIYTPQPLYGATVAPLTPATAATNPHVGTTGVYWIYRPDANQAKYTSGTNFGLVKGAPDITSDLPVPQAFGSASPTVFVDPTVATATPVASNATVYIGNSNGVLYAFDALGIPATAERFNASLDLRVNATDPVIPTCQPKWWFTLRGPNADLTTATSSADIESAPALYVDTTTTPGSYLPRVYIGSAHEQESTSNVGRLYALDGLLGPSGDNGRSPAQALSVGAPPANYTGPGSFNYNIGQRPQTSKADTLHWSFPDGVGTDAYSTGKSSTGAPRPALGNITGSPVVFTNLYEVSAPRRTRIYFAANTGLEVPTGSAAGTAASARPDDTTTGRVWAVNLDGSVGTVTTNPITLAVSTTAWAYPQAWDPNDATKDTTAEPYAPIGSFLNSTPAIGFVQFPTTITNGDGSTYTPTDVIFNTGGGSLAPNLKGQSVPMLYIGTRGVNDTSLYGVDIDGTMTGAANGDSRTIYRVVSPDGSLFQSSPILITNATSTTVTNPPGPGNGGSILITAGDTLYDFGATPIANPIAPTAGFLENYPLIRENRAFVGFGPISGPAVAAADVSDLQGFGTTYETAGTLGTATGNVTDWVYVGDSSTGFCRGITPRDLGDLNIPPQLANIVPKNPNPPQFVIQTSIVQTYLVQDTDSGSTNSTKALAVGPMAALPVYEWGQNIYLRFKNVVPPNPTNSTALYLHDISGAAPSTGNPATYYSNGGPIEFDLSESDGDANTTGLNIQKIATDHGTVPALVITALPANGFIQRSDAAPTAANATATNNLVDGGGNTWIGAYTYAIGDGTVRRNTPGGRREVKRAHQTVMAYTTTDGMNFTPGVPTTLDLGASATSGNEVTVTNAAGQPAFQSIPPVDQPTFGILNPLGLRAGGIPLPVSGATTAAVQIGDELGPFRPVSGGTLPATGSAAVNTTAYYDLEALTDGNDVYTLHAPPSTSGIGDPTQLQAVGTAAGGITPTQTRIVVTSTPLISHNSSSDNLDLSGGTLPTGNINNADPRGLSIPTFGSPTYPYAVDVFDRTPLGLPSGGNRTVSVKMNLADNNGSVSVNGSGSGSGGIYWNSNASTLPDPSLDPVRGSIVNYLPWETLPTAYKTGSANTSPDYPDISPQNMSATLHSPTYGEADLQGSNGTLEPAYVVSGTTGDPVTNRTIRASPLQVHITVPPHQPANQQVYIGTNGGGYNSTGETTPLNLQAGPLMGTSNLTANSTFPMGYVTTRRIFVPNRQGIYSPGSAYRDIRVYTGVPVDMSTSIANPTVDIGIVPAAFGVQTEQYMPAVNPLGLFTPYNPYYPTYPAFQNYFKPLEVHNDGNVNLLNVHFDQKLIANGAQSTLALHSDAVDLLSILSGYDLTGVTGPRTGTLPNNVTEEPYLIRTSVDTDLVDAYLQSTPLALSGYVGATFHKPLPGGDAPSILTVPDSPEDATSAYYIPPSPTGLPSASATQTTPPLVSLAMPFGTPVGTYATNPPSDPASLRLFEGLDVPTANTTQNQYSLNPTQIFYPPFYGGKIGGLYSTPGGGGGLPPPTTASLAGNDVYTGAQPFSTTGTQLSGTVEEQRLTDGFTYGAVPMIDGGLAGGTTAAPLATPDFAPAGFRDPTSGDLSVYWTSGRTAGTYGIVGANLPFTPDPTGNTLGTGYFLPTTPTAQWWQPIPAPVVSTAGTNSGLTIAQDSTNAANIYAFAVNVAPATATMPYSNTLYSYTVTPSTGALANPQAVSNDPSQIKYGIKGLATGTNFTQNLWAFWTTSTHGRTAIAYNATTGGSAWPTTTLGTLPIPAGLTSVADPSPLVMPGNGTLPTSIEVTYSGTGPSGNVDLYVSRYLPDATTSTKLDLTPFPPMTEILTPVTASAVSGWYQARDAAWSRTGALNLFVTTLAGTVTPILYSTGTTPAPLFKRAIFDKASGLLVLTGISGALKDAGGNNVFAPGTGTVTVYVDAATGRVRFTGGAPLTTETVTALFNPLARRLTTDPRADTAPITLLDRAVKPNEAVTLGLTPVAADRCWTIWRKSGIGGDPASATLYMKSQRLTLFLTGPIGVSPAPALLLNSVTVNGTDVTSQVDVDYTRGRIYFPISTGAEGQPAVAKYTDANGATQTVSDPVQWQDEAIVNDVTNIPTTTLAGLNTVLDYKVPIHTAVNENNVTAFLDPFASATSEHKLWLFWNSTRNGTADIYSETINPKF